MYGVQIVANLIPNKDFSFLSVPAQTLPAHAQLDIGALAQLFSTRSTSYKYLFFLSLLDSIVQATDAQTAAASNYYLELFSAKKDHLLSIPLKTVIINLLQFGWYPHRFFRLSYGRTDQVGQALDKLDFTVDEHAITHPQTRQNLRLAIEEQFNKIRAQRFTRFVPYRLLTPFFTKKLRGQPDHRKNELIIQLAREKFRSPNAPFYCFNEVNDQLIIHPLWHSYFRQHYAIVRGWALLQWAQYLQTNNPSVPAILFKLEPPAQRGSLYAQRQYWQNILNDGSLRCIYSDQILDPQNFSLDHFLPWSFICHDQLWNLIPTTPSANSSKGRRLPSQDKINDFIIQQHHGLKVYQRLYQGQKPWHRAVDEYVEGLSIAESDLLDKGKLFTAYRKKLDPLYSLAKNMGY